MEETEIQQDMIQCPGCGVENSYSLTKCRVCNTELKPRKPAPIERATEIIAKLVLFVGILVALIVIFTALDEDDVWVYVGIGLGSLLFSVVTWNILMLLRNISLYLKKAEKKS